MKKSFTSILIITILALTSLIGCGLSTPETLRVGVAIAYPPFEYYDTDNVTPTGYDVELITEIAARIGMNTEFIDKEWNDIFDGLRKDEYDCIVSAVTITDERIAEFDFSDSYIQNYPCIVVLKETDNKPTSPMDLEGMSVCYQRGTTSENYISQYKANNGLNCDTYGYTKIESCFEELSLKRVDAIFVDSTVASCYCTDEDSLYEVTWQQDGAPEEFGIVIPKSNPELTDKINNALSDMKADGTIDALIDKYF